MVTLAEVAKRITAKLGGEGGHDVALIAPELTVRAGSGRAPA